MKSRFTRLALLSAVVLTTPLLTFAGGQPARARMVGTAEMQDRTGLSRGIQQGKGAGLSLSRPVIRADAYRARTPAETQSPRTQSPQSDTAFRK